MAIAVPTDSQDVGRKSRGAPSPPSAVCWVNLSGLIDRDAVEAVARDGAVRFCGNPAAACRLRVAIPVRQHIAALAAGRMQGGAMGMAMDNHIGARYRIKGI